MTELTQPVALTRPDGLLNPAAIGFARRPVVDTSGLARGPRRSWGRAKRWEYWNVIADDFVMALTVSSIDYAAVHEIWVYQRSTGRSWGQGATVLPPRRVVLPATLEGGTASARARNLAIDITPTGSHRGGGAASVRLRARCATASFDITVRRPDDHDCLAVVVPWSATRFQYTVKDVALPASGSVTVAGERHELDSAWAVLDHGRGRWPYDARWNWGAGSGVGTSATTGHDEVTVGLQVGGQWTDGTGQTENGVIVDGVLHKIESLLTWDFDRRNPDRPWHVTGGGLSATMTPFFMKRSRTQLGVVSSRTDQAFGHWSGAFSADGVDVTFDHLVGWAEDVHQRW